MALSKQWQTQTDVNNSGGCFYAEEQPPICHKLTFLAKNGFLFQKPNQIIIVVRRYTDIKQLDEMASFS